MSNQPRKQKVGAGWKFRTRSEKEGIKLILDEGIMPGKFVMWPNGFKENDRHPDYVIYVDDYDGGNAAPVPTPTPAPQPATVPPQNESREMYAEDDIPF